MSDRSRLLKKVLETWDHSLEGQRYLIWLLQPEAEKLDGGDILREAVLDVIQVDDQLRRLRSTQRDQRMEEFLAEHPLSPTDESSARKLWSDLCAVADRQAKPSGSKREHWLKFGTLLTVTGSRLLILSLS
jgi:hypothetical protein